MLTLTDRLVGHRFATILTEAGAVNCRSPSPAGNHAYHGPPSEEPGRNDMVDETRPTTSASGGRERILEEALGRFLEAGYAAVSMQQIADASGVTKATLYHHFRDKEDLFFEAMRTGFLRSHEAMQHAALTGETVRERLIHFASYLFSSEHTDLNRLFGDFHQHVSPERRAAFWQTFQRPWTYLEAPIGAAIEHGELAPGDPALIARVVFTALAGQLQIARFEENLPSLDDAVATAIVDMLLDGMRAKDSPSGEV